MYSFHKKIPLSFFLFLVFQFSISINAQMEISGFFDAIGVNNFQISNSNHFLINQFEIDASYENQSHYSVGTAIAYNNEMERMELAMAFIHYTFDDSRGKHPRREEEYNHSALQIGMFDIPFGLDYLSYASIDRPTVTQPLVIEKTIAGWNDIGIDYHLFKEHLKFDIWAVNGFAKGIGIGGNIRYKLFPSMEIGVSHSTDLTDFKRITDWLSGIDLKITSTTFQLKSELLQTKGIYEGNLDTVLNNAIHYGGYLQLLTKLKEWTTLPLFLTLRIGSWQCSNKDKGIDDSQYRYTASLGYKLDDNLLVRLEVAANYFEKIKTETEGYIQIVVSF